MTAPELAAALERYAARIGHEPPCPNCQTLLDAARLLRELEAVRVAAADAVLTHFAHDPSMKPDHADMESMRALRTALRGAGGGK